MHLSKWNPFPGRLQTEGEATNKIISYKWLGSLKAHHSSAGPDEKQVWSLSLLTGGISVTMAECQLEAGCFTHYFGRTEEFLTFLQEAALSLQLIWILLPLQTSLGWYTLSLLSWPGPRPGFSQSQSQVMKYKMWSDRPSSWLLSLLKDVRRQCLWQLSSEIHTEVHIKHPCCSA